MAYTTIDDPSAHHQTALYTGTGSGQSITNSGNSDLQPDWVWVKDRSATNDHKLTDSSRIGGGSGPTITIESNTTNAEYDDQGEGTDATTSFNSDGFTIGTNGNYNTDDNTYVAWQWKANGGSLTTNDASATSVGNQDSTYQANTTAGFSIGIYDGVNQTGTMAHGLGAIPHVMIVKCRSATEPWEVYHHKNTSAPETEYIRLNTSAATADSAHIWVDTAPTSAIFTVGNTGSGNEVDKTYMWYMWTEIQGYSKFGSYAGNNSADGTFVYLGFKPAWVMVKRTDAGTNNWPMWDNKRGINGNRQELYANLTNADATDSAIDILSNGFKLRNNSTEWNNGTNYVYMAFAEQPFVTSGGVPCTAN